MLTLELLAPWIAETKNKSASSPNNQSYVNCQGTPVTEE